MVFLIQRIDFDNSDPWDPLRTSVVGYCKTRDEANGILPTFDQRVEHRYYGYDELVYPSFSVVAVPELIDKMEFT